MADIEYQDWYCTMCKADVRVSFDSRSSAHLPVMQYRHDYNLVPKSPEEDAMSDQHDNPLSLQDQVEGRSVPYGTPPPPRYHQNVEHLLSLFEFEHLPEHLALISMEFHSLAYYMAEKLEGGIELAAGLRKLLEAKDCCVRQAVIDHRNS